MITPGIDHIALNVPDLDAQIERLTTAVGLVVEHRFGDFALLSDPTNGLKLELGRSEDDQVHFRHVGVRADDVDRAHQHLVDTGMETTLEPHRRDFAAMYTSFLHQEGCVDVQSRTSSTWKSTTSRISKRRASRSLASSELTRWWRVRDHAVPPEELTGRRASLEDAVGQEQDGVARLQGHGRLAGRCWVPARAGARAAPRSPRRRLRGAARRVGGVQRSRCSPRRNRCRA